MTKLDNYLKQLNQTEQSIYIMMGMGLSNKEIANQVFKSETAVKAWTYRLYKKLGFKGRAQAIVNYMDLTDFGVPEQYTHLTKAV